MKQASQTFQCTQRLPSGWDTCLACGCIHDCWLHEPGASKIYQVITFLHRIVNINQIWRDLNISPWKEVFSRHVKIRATHIFLLRNEILLDDKETWQNIATKFFCKIIIIREKRKKKWSHTTITLRLRPHSTTQYWSSQESLDQHAGATKSTYISTKEIVQENDSGLPANNFLLNLH